jgi:hypothetical protein
LLSTPVISDCEDFKPPGRALAHLFTTGLV